MLKNEKSPFLITLVSLLAIFIISGCSSTGSTDSEDDTTNSNATITLKIADATSSNADTGIALVEFAESVEKESNGEIKVDVYSDGVLGSEAKTIEQVRSGDLQMQLMHSISIFEQYDPSLAIDELPFIFEDREDAYAAYDGKVGEIINKKAEDLGFKILGYWEHGLRHFTNNKRPIETPEDLKGIKFRVAETDYRREVLEGLGASAIIMGFDEAYSALQQGTIDGQENPISTIYTSNLHEVQDYLSLSAHIWGAAPLVINLDLWEGLSEEHQKIIEDNAIKYRDIQRERHAKESEENLQKLKDAGMKVNEIDREAFQEFAKPIIEKAREDRFGDELMDALEEYR